MEQGQFLLLLCMSIHICNGKDLYFSEQPETNLQLAQLAPKAAAWLCARYFMLKYGYKIIIF